MTSRRRRRAAIRIAHLTDLHLRRSLPGTSAVARRRSRLVATLLPLALEEIRRSGVDLLAITGDLLDVPGMITRPVPGFLVDEPAFWRAAALRDYRWCKGLLDRSGLRYVVLPGNHDDEEAMWRVFDPRANQMVLAGHRVLRFCDREHEGHVPRRYVPERERLDRALGDLRGPPQVHLQHYVVAPALNEGYPHTYAEGASLARELVRSGRVRLSLSGHYHPGTGILRRGGMAFATGPAFCEAPFRWRLFDLGSGAVRLIERELGEGCLPSRPAVFLDRDGVINDLASYSWGPERFRLVPGAAAAIRRLNRAGRSVVVVTGQSSVGAGYVPREVVDSVHDRMARLLAAEGAEVDAVYYFTGAGEASVLPGEARRRLSKVPLIEQARRELGLAGGGGWMVGDRESDVAAAARAGLRPVLVRTGVGAREAGTCRRRFPGLAVVADLAAAVDLILRRSG